MEFTRRRSAVLALLSAVALSPSADAAPAQRTAIIRSTEITAIGQRGAGLSLGSRALIAQCNMLRQQKGLPPREPPASLLDQADRVDHLYAYDGIRKQALNRSTAHVIEMDDLHRYMRQQMQGPAPDCAAVTLVDAVSGTLWRDGQRYDLDYRKKTATRLNSRPGDRVPQNLPARPVAGRPDEIVAGQRCSVQNAPGLPGAVVFPEQCLWRGFDDIGYLNLPLVLKRTYVIGGGEHLTGRETASSAVADAPLPADFFAIPAGFTVRDYATRR